MASIFKRGRDTKDKKKKRHACYWISYFDENGKWRTTKGFTDQGETERLAAKLEHEARLRRRGLIDPEQERLVERKKVPLTDHLAAFERSLTGNSSRYVKLLMGRIRLVITGCGFERVSDIDIDIVETFLRELAKKKGFGHRTYNHYVQGLDQFCTWMVKTRRITGNPLVGMKRLNTEVDIRHPRRALTAKEVAKLVQSARDSGEEIQCFDGETRARIYLLSFFTGLRRNEIASLTPRSFDLKGNPPTVTVEAAFSKHRRRDVLPLHAELVAMLNDWLAGRDSNELLFPELGRRRTWVMVKKDLERVGIPYETPEGIADFHAAGRHSHITELLRNGASLPEAKELARHCDVRMTMRYTHVGMEDRARAVQRLPWQQIGSSPRVPTSPAVTSRDTKNVDGKGQPRAGSRNGEGTSDTAWRSESPSDSSDAERPFQVRFPPPPLT